MLYEIDFIPVGEESSSGDAICVRYSLDSGNTWYVGVIDGGDTTAGKEVCKHIRGVYQTEIVDFLISTHPDRDHASGLSVVMDELKIQNVFMHCPWDYLDYFFDSVVDKRVSKESLKQRLIAGHPYAYAVYERAKKDKIPILYPFSDHNDHGIPSLHFVGPSSSYYLKQVINFRSITAITEEKSEIEKLLEDLLKGVNKVAKWAVESWSEESLANPSADATSSENLSSVITLIYSDDGTKCLFTADAGVPSLEEAANYMEKSGIRLEEFNFIQLPHHGSKRNIGPDILDRLVGGTQWLGFTYKFTAYISAAKKGEPKHPSRRVMNAATRRGGKVFVNNKGVTRCHSNTGLVRENWSTSVDAEPFYSEVDSDE